jgi:hypothetical protein
MAKCIGITDKESHQLYESIDAIVKMIREGSLTIEPTIVALQAIVEGKHEPKKEAQEPEKVICGVFSGGRCTIDGSFFDEGDICMHGHQIGQSYIR